MVEIAISGLSGYKELMRARLSRYCGYDTSSVSVERAGEVMRSAAYVVGAGMDALLAGGKAASDAQECFDEGLIALEKRRSNAKSALNFARETAPAVDNLALGSTLGAGLELFFSKYETQFAAHEIPADIDYPLYMPVSDEVEGLDYIEEYLRRITYENLYLSKFSGQELSALLRRRYASPRELVINIFGEALEDELTKGLPGKADFDAEYPGAVSAACAGLTGNAEKYAAKAALEAKCLVKTRVRG